ncbi:oxidase [Lithospermum erythrorhizon]|uniref:Oxidase n=1 Tax=Lithospermum erythrorhizon TaxID=34254 RepID=A0AAV3R0N7_LITER
MLRIVCATLNNHAFFNVAEHTMTVVAIDAIYTTPYVADIIVLSPGQTVDILITADQKPASLKGLQNGPHWTPVPNQVDEHMFIATGLGVTECKHEDTYLCQGPNNTFMAASLNNASFQLPTTISLLEAYYNNVSGIYTTDFPDEPPIKFNYTSFDIALDPILYWVTKGTKVKRLKYNSTVEIVFQNTAFVTPESHPIHLHGFNFYVLAQGHGNFNPLSDREMFNLVNPHMRNTIAIPIGGWAAIRFIANNPGVWYMHCHLELHVPLGLATTFIVEDGPTAETTLPPPPIDYPTC